MQNELKNYNSSLKRLIKCSLQFETWDEWKHSVLITVLQAHSWLTKIVRGFIPSGPILSNWKTIINTELGVAQIIARRELTDTPNRPKEVRLLREPGRRDGSAIKRRLTAAAYQHRTKMRPEVEWSVPELVATFVGLVITKNTT